MTALKDWLIVIRAPTLGAAKLGTLLQQFGSPGGLRSQSAARLRQCGVAAVAIEALKSPDLARLEADLAWLGQSQHHLLTFDDADYPPSLKQISTPPPALFAVGDPALLWLPQLAIVGSRHPTAGGLRHAREFATYIAGHGLVVTSGLAQGIDGAAHQAALAAGGPTVAVAATGLDQVYPAKHQALARDIAANGILISEYPPGTGPRAGQFPARNRLISGLSMGTLVVEAGIRSGSLITARLAAEQGREVFALPGSIDNPLARGCHRLIQQGAKLVASGEDVVQELAPQVQRSVAALRAQLHALPVAAAGAPKTLEPAPLAPTLAEDDDYQRLLAAIGFDSVIVDTLVETTGLTADAVSSMLLILELNGHIEAGPGGTYCRVGEDNP